MKMKLSKSELKELEGMITLLEFYENNCAKQIFHEGCLTYTKEHFDTWQNKLRKMVEATEQQRYWVLQLRGQIGKGMIMCPQRFTMAVEHPANETAKDVAQYYAARLAKEEIAILGCREITKEAYLALVIPEQI